MDRPRATAGPGTAGVAGRGATVAVLRVDRDRLEDVPRDTVRGTIRLEIDGVREVAADKVERDELLVADRVGERSV